MMRDTLLAARVELRDIKQRIASLIAEVDEALLAEDRAFDRIMAEVRASDEAQATFGALPTHSVIIPPGAFCCDVGSDEPE